MQKRLTTGLWPVMLTPFQKNNEVDYKALEELTWFYIKAGAKGLFPNCLSSEMFQLTDQERLKIISSVVNIASENNVDVVASGTFSTDMVSNAEFIKKACDKGVNAVVLLSNQLADIEEDDEIFKRNVETIIQLTNDIPLGIYESPYPYKRLISPSLMKWLGQTGRFSYHKDTSCDPVSIERKIASLAGTDCSFYNAHTGTSLLSLEMGGEGLSVIGANFYPELYVYMINEYNAKGATADLKKLNDQLNLMDAVASQSYPYSAKLFLQYRKLTLSSTCRISYKNMSRENHLNLKSLEQFLHSVVAEYGIEINN